MLAGSRSGPMRELAPSRSSAGMVVGILASLVLLGAVVGGAFFYLNRQTPADPKSNGSQNAVNNRTEPPKPNPAKPPEITSINPTSGPATGDTVVTVNGTGFAEASTVKFGGVAATKVTFVDNTQLKATSPAGTGVVDVQVTAGEQISATSDAAKFTYSGPTVTGPTVTSISPASGPATGGTVATIHGTGFAAASTVNFGGAPATKVTFVDNTQLKATSPTGTGVVDVQVTTAGQSSAPAAVARFTYSGQNTTPEQPVDEKTRAIVDSLVKQGKEYMDKEQFSQALDSFQQAAAKDPSDRAANRYLVLAQKAKERQENEQASQKKQTEYQVEYKGYMEEGLKALQVGNFVDAFGFALKAQRVIPHDPLAISLEQQARRGLSGGTGADDKQLQYKQWMDAGAAALALRRFVEAEMAFSQALNLVPFDPRAMQQIANVRTMRKQTEDQFQIQMTQGKQFVDAGTVQNAAAQYQTSTLQFQQAMNAFQNATQIFPDNIDAQTAFRNAQQGFAYSSAMNNATVAMAIPRFDLALLSFTEALKVVPNDFPAQKGLASANAGLVDAKQRADFFDRNLAAASLLVNQQRYVEANRLLADAVIIAPQHPNLGPAQGLLQYVTSMIEGRIATDKRNYQNAFDAYTAALSTLGLLPNAATFFPQAQPITQQLLDKADQDLKTAQVRYADAMTRGQAALANKKYQDAVPAYTDALAAMPNDSLAQNLVLYGNYMLNGQSATTKKIYQDAVDAFTAALGALPKGPAFQQALLDTQLALKNAQDLLQTAPTVTSINPTSGPTGSIVTINGTGFSAASTVTFGNLAAPPPVTFVNNTQLTATAPAGNGTVDVQVNTAGQTSATSAAAKFTYTSTGPTVASINPTTGPATGGTVVTINGTGFAFGSTVTFGGAAATKVTVVKNTQITANSPAWNGGGGGYVVGDILTVNLPTGVSGFGTVTTNPQITVTSVIAGGVASFTVSNQGIFSQLPPLTLAVPTTDNTTTTATGFSLSIGSSNCVAISGNYGIANTIGVGYVVDVQVTAAGQTSATSAADQFIYAGPTVTGPTVTSINPTLGPTGTVVTIKGTGFTAASTVTFGGVAAPPPVTFVNNTQLTATAPAGNGVVDVQVTTAKQTSATSAAAKFTYTSTGPTVASIIPATGPATGGTVVTINGTGFAPGSTVTFGGAAATKVTVVKNTQITATSPAWNGGGGGYVVGDILTVNLPTGVSGFGTVTINPQITVTSVIAGGVASFTVSNQGMFSQLPPLTLAVPTTDNTTITATGFTLSIGLSNCVAISGNYGIANTIGVGYVVDVQVTAAGQTSVKSAADQFIYAGPTVTGPTVTSVNPASGPTGTVVTIKGTGFSAASTVTFGSVAATPPVTFVNNTQLTAIAPAGTGTVDVQVNTAGQTSATSATAKFTYTATGPTVANINPATGPATGGTVVTINGNGFATGSTVTFGGAAATKVTVVNNIQITATSPAWNGGGGGYVVGDILTVNLPTGVSGFGTVTINPQITVTSVLAGGVSSFTVANQGLFSQLPPLTLAIPTTDTTTVAATGFTLSIGSVNCAPISGGYGIANTIGVGYVVDVQVTAAGQTSVKSAADQFTYSGPTVTGPTVTSLNPASGPTGTVVAINGTGFTPASKVKFGNASANFTFVNPNQLTATAPAGNGIVDVQVTIAGQTSATSAVTKFTYAAAGPTVANINPMSGQAGTVVTINGTGFTVASTVKFGKALANVTFVNPNQLTATAPAGNGVVHVQVTTVGQPSATSPADQFTYTAAAGPTVTNINPMSGQAGTVVTINGTGFTVASTVKFGKALANVTFVNPNQLTATAPAGSGVVDVHVTTAGQTSAPAPASQFTYAAAAGPTVTNINPMSGQAGTVVTINGTGFTPTLKVRFGNASANFTFVNPNQLTATAPAGNGVVDVHVTTAGQTSAPSPASQFTYAAAAGPTISSISPVLGSGGTAVTINGTGFTPASKVKFGNAAAANVFFVSPTRLTAISPAGNGTVHIQVTNGGLSSPISAADQFTMKK